MRALRLLPSLGLSFFSVAAAFAQPQLSLPLDCDFGKSCFIQSYVDHNAGQSPAKDYLCGTRTYQKHNGTDFRIASMAAQRAGVAVLAAADGVVLRIRDGVPDISVRAATAPSVDGRECGNAVIIDHGDGWQGQYCHMAQGSIAVKPGDRVKRAMPIGKVGLSGQTEFPHLHFTVRHNGEVIDPFSTGLQGDACGATRTLWTSDAEKRLAYKTRLVLNRGFSDHVVTMEEVENGADQTIPAKTTPALVPFIRMIGLEAGDRIDFTLKGPDGAVLAQHLSEPLDHSKAQYLSIIGRKRPADGFPPGRYDAIVRVLHDGQTVVEEHFSLQL